ncbi:hypothetical protein [uncultured Kordia sp.]|uniref:hypothetical protein n=1 Tax=uncultured Kordia sp. TaxID=507699 RepID=UPI00260177BA|nr:hypothetical protein [uncultured Kordia sp.]
MTEAQKNGLELSQFVNTHKLRNKNGIILFNALISIFTTKNKLLNQQLEVMISFDNYNSYGDLKFLTGELDPYLFPTDFEAKWQKFENEPDHLLITGNHTQNKDIGKYSVKVTPLGLI